MQPSTKPASASICRSDRSQTAPAIQSDHSPLCTTSSSVTSSCSRMSAICRQPARRRTRYASASTAGLSGQRLNPPLAAEQLSVASSLLDHLPAEINANDLACWPHSSSGEKAVQAHSAAQVEDGLPRKDCAQAQRIANPAEGFRYRGRQ